MTVPLLEVEHLGVSFPTPRGRLHALRDVSLSLERGRTLGIVGESGSGKSMFARALMHLLPTTAEVDPASTIRFEGEDVSRLAPEAARHFWGVRMSMVFQDPMTSLTPVVRIGKQLEEPLRYHLGLDRRAARHEAVRLLERVAIPQAERRLRQYPHSLSGGMRQRVLIAIAVACSPSLLIADEPTTALDVTIQAQILGLLRTLRDEEGMATILVSHDLGVVAGQADEIAVMYAGRVVERAPARSLFSEMRHPYTAALFDSIPRLENPPHTRLRAVPGRPPLVVDPPPGCSFAPRCARVQERCRAETPVLEPVGDGHVVACFNPSRPS